MAAVLRKMAEECDLVIVSGSTSAGIGDMIFRVFEEVGQLIFHGVNFKPGKPALFGLINGKPCFGLPGYPTSALAVFSNLAAPAIRAALGQGHTKKKVAGTLSGPLRFDGRRQMFAVGLSKGLIYPVDKGSGSITTLAGADGIIDVPLGVEYLNKGEKMVVELFGELEPSDLVVAGENSLPLEKLAESMPLRIKLLNNGSMRAMLFLGDGVADLAAVCGPEEWGEGMSLVGSFKRELGLAFRDADVLSNLADQRIVGWHRDSALYAQFERHLQSMGLAHPQYARAARTHSAVAAAVASGRADVGFVERQAAEEAGLVFERLQNDEVRLLARPESVDSVPLRSFVMAVSQERVA
jgi:putative molybdopterin biosynthesis protein